MINLPSAINISLYYYSKKRGVHQNCRSNMNFDTIVSFTISTFLKGCRQVFETSYETFFLTHWGRVTHICVSKLTTIASDNGLSPGRRQAIIWTSAGLLLIGPPLGTNFSEISIETITFSLKKMRLKVSSAKWRSCCPGLNVHSKVCRGAKTVFRHQTAAQNLKTHSLSSYF